MILRFSILTPDTPATPCNDTLSAVNYGVATVDISNAGNIVVSGVINAVFPSTIYFTDNSGNMQTCNVTLSGDVITCAFVDLYNVFDSITFTLTVTNAGYHTYSQEFTIYGYDLGNDVGIGVNTNPNFDIVLISSFVGHPYSGVIAYRKPFTNLIHFYKNNSSLYATLELYDEADTLVSLLPFGTLCSDEDKEFYYTTIYNGETCTQTVNTVVDYIQWIPTFEVTTECVADCSSECITTLSSSTVTINIDYSTLDTIYINDGVHYPYIAQGLQYDIIDYSGTIVSTEKATNNILFGITAANYTHTFSAYTIPSSGDYFVRGCIQVLGYTPQGIFDGTLDNGTYYQIWNNLTAADFTTGGAANNNLYTTFLADGNPVTWSTNGKVFEVFDDITDLTDDTYYVVPDLVAGDDFSNLTDAWMATNLNCFAYNGVAPTDWTNGTVVITVLPVATCCQTLTITGCDVYEIEQVDCDSLIIHNRSTGAISYEIFMFSDGDYTSITSDDIPALTDEDITLSTQGIYRIDVTVGGETVSYIRLSYCDIEACKLMYLNKIICCNPEGNCGSCDDCGQKDYYDFNAFSIIMNTYFTLANELVNLDYTYSTEEILGTTLTSKLRSMEELLDKAADYCEVCDEPCTNCN